jgi:hypothetical protein
MGRKEGGLGGISAVCWFGVWSGLPAALGGLPAALWLVAFGIGLSLFFVIG